MQIFGFEITRTKQKAVSPLLSSVDNRGGWFRVGESYPGAWQSNVEVTNDSILAFAAVYACIALIASDIAKMRIKLVQLTSDGIWVETENPAFSPVLRKPNHYQNRIQFVENWIMAKLIEGNTYVLKQRDQRQVVVAEYVLDPNRCRPLVAPNGDVYYELKRDDLSRVPEDKAVVVPATEIMHDRVTPLFHPLVGVSPLRACGVAAIQGLRIQDNSAQLFGNGSNPGGVLTAPGFIKQETADRLKAYWDENFTGANVGKVAVLGDGLKFEQMTMKAVDAQLIEQLKWTAENVCTAFRVPPYMIGVGQPPNFNNIEALTKQYYTQCIQTHVESFELLQDEGLGLATGGPQKQGVECDLDDLFRMDMATLIKSIADGINAGVYSPNDGRRKVNLPPVPGGDDPMLQQQYWPLRMLAERPIPEGPNANAPAPKSEPDVDIEREIAPFLTKELETIAA